ncbi:MAG TPA: hypothetical protein VL993_14830 [Stellaceae bacterium]|nr:hypothetical protein [Stellaceae bacterium]
MTKAAKKRPPAGHPGLAPPPERWRRGEVEALPRAIPDDEGRPSLPYRAIDTLARMQRKGSITEAMRQAGEDFHALFVRATLDPLRCADLNRISGGVRALSESEAQTEARNRVWRALGAMGGIASPAGSCAWHVLGCEWSLKDWALREGWGGRPVSQEQAGGVLVAALGVLTAMYGR